MLLTIPRSLKVSNTEGIQIQHKRTEKTKEKGRKITFHVNGEIKRFRRCGFWSCLWHQAIGNTLGKLSISEKFKNPHIYTVLWNLQSILKYAQVFDCHSKP